jgi:molybdopterin-containing oxidoreductase family membrane subunit
LLSSLGHVFGVKRFEPLSKRAIFLAIVLLVSGFLVIASDLERPWLMALYVLVTPNPTSAIWWMGTLYGIYFIVLMVEFFFLCRAEAIRRLQTESSPAPVIYRILAVGTKKSAESSLRMSARLAKLTGAGGIILAIAALSTLGAVFGLTGSRSLWYGPLLPIYFVLSAFLAGGAVLALATVLTYRVNGREALHNMKEAIVSLGRLLVLFLGIYLLFTVWNLLTAQYGRIPEEYESVMVLISGPLAVPFWVGEIFLGLLVPVFILVYTRAQSVWGVAVASLLVVIGMFAARYDFIVAGQLVPVIGRETLWQYAPSMIEILTVLGAFSLCLFLYSLGNRLFPLEDVLMVFKPAEETETPEVAVS